MIRARQGREPKGWSGQRAARRSWAGLLLIAGSCLLSVSPGALPTEESANSKRPDEDGKESQAPAAASSRPSDPRDLGPEGLDVYEETPALRAVDQALLYLRETQQADGSWLSPGYGKDAGIVSLAILAFLARGHEPGRGEFGERIERAILWIMGAQQANGLIVGSSRQTASWPMYGHGMATLLLGQVVGMIPENRAGFEELSRVHRDAVNLVLKAQNLYKARTFFGGWRYRPTSTDSDLSVTGWQLLALRAAEEAGLAVPRKNIEQAVEFVGRCARPGGEFVYHPGEDQTSIALTGTGVLSLQLCGEHDSAEARRGGDWLLQHPLRWRGRWFYYSAYYGAQAMFQLGGRHWERWKSVSEQLLLEHQREDGHWPFPPGTELEAQAGPAYSTALAVLSLAVEFRYLPIYQR